MLTTVQRLKLDLLADGLTLTPAARAELAGAEGTRPLTLADYPSTSGISLEMEDDVWVNAPLKDFNPNFVKDAPHRLDVRAGRFYVYSGDTEVAASPVPVPEYAGRSSRSGVPFPNLGITHTDRVRISPIEGCIGGCRFCDMPTRYEYRTKSADDLVEAVAQALADPLVPAKHVLISGGTPKPEDFDYLIGVYRAVVMAFPDVAVDIMMTPVPGLLDFQELYDLGVNGLAMNLELHDKEIARSVMPLKSSLPGEHWLGMLSRAAKVFGPGRVRSLLMLGLEPMESTLAGVAAIAECSCEPVLSPFRPSPDTALGDLQPPTAQQLAETYEAAVEVAARYGAKLGPRCIPCQHNTVSFPDGSDYYFRH